MGFQSRVLTASEALTWSGWGHYGLRCSYRQLDHWTRRLWPERSRGQGPPNYRRWSEEDLERIAEQLRRWAAVREAHRRAVMTA